MSIECKELRLPYSYLAKYEQGLLCHVEYSSMFQVPYDQVHKYIVVTPRQILCDLEGIKEYDRDNTKLIHMLKNQMKIFFEDFYDIRADLSEYNIDLDITVEQLIERILCICVNKINIKALIENNSESVGRIKEIAINIGELYNIIAFMIRLTKHEENNPTPSYLPPSFKVYELEDIIG